MFGLVRCYKTLFKIRVLSVDRCILEGEKDSHFMSFLARLSVVSVDSNEKYSIHFVLIFLTPVFFLIWYSQIIRFRFLRKWWVRNCANTAFRKSSLSRQNASVHLSQKEIEIIRMKHSIVFLLKKKEQQARSEHKYFSEIKWMSKGIQLDDAAAPKMFSVVETQNSKGRFHRRRFKSRNNQKN